MATRDSNKHAHAADIAEWILAALGMALLSVALGFILYRAVVSESKPASLSVSIESIERGEQGYRVDFRVTNSGSQTAATVVIEGELSRAGQTVEKSNATLTHAPANSTRGGGLYFTNDPNLYDMKVRVLGFERP